MGLNFTGSNYIMSTTRISSEQPHYNSAEFQKTIGLIGKTNRKSKYLIKFAILLVRLTEMLILKIWLSSMHMQLKVWCKMEGFARDSKD
jgi:hypothetical protein